MSREEIYERITDNEDNDCYIKRGDLVRCKDCKWAEPVNGGLLCGAWDAKAVDDDDYCSDGERREPCK